MQKWIALFTLVAAAVFWAACDTGSATDERGRVTAERAEDELMIPVEGMVCVACVSRVNRTVAQLDGVDSVETDFAQRQVRVAFDPQSTTADEIAAAIEELGYQPGEPERKEVPD